MFEKYSRVFVWPGPRYFWKQIIEKKFTLDFFKASNVAKKRLFFLGVRKNGIIL